MRATVASEPWTAPIHFVPPIVTHSQIEHIQYVPRYVLRSEKDSPVYC